MTVIAVISFSTMITRSRQAPKYQQVYGALGQRHPRRAVWKPGDRLPSEADLVGQFGASRITVGRAVRDLQLAGLVERRAGSGTYVKAPRAAREASRSGS